MSDVKITSISAYLKKNIIAVSSGFDVISVPITKTFDASKHKKNKILITMLKKITNCSVMSMHYK